MGCLMLFPNIQSHHINHKRALLQRLNHGRVAAAADAAAAIGILMGF